MCASEFVIVVRLVSRSALAFVVFFLMIRRPPRSTLDRSSAASDVYKRQAIIDAEAKAATLREWAADFGVPLSHTVAVGDGANLSLIHISEPTRPY